MNRIIKTHYPAEKLPEDLREGLPAGTFVSVTVEEEPIARPPRTPDELKTQIERARKTIKHPLSAEEVVRQIRTLRDEWDD